MKAKRLFDNEAIEATVWLVSEKYNTLIKLVIVIVLYTIVIGQLLLQSFSVLLDN